MAVNAGGTALQKFFFLVLQKKVAFFGRICFPDSDKKNSGTQYTSFFDILTSFGEKKLFTRLL